MKRKTVLWQLGVLFICTLFTFYVVIKLYNVTNDRNEVVHDVAKIGKFELRLTQDITPRSIVDSVYIVKTDVTLHEPVYSTEDYEIESIHISKIDSLKKAQLDSMQKSFDRISAILRKRVE